MKMHVGYVSASDAGDYYQVLFEERDPDSDSETRQSRPEILGFW